MTYERFISYSCADYFKPLFHIFSLFYEPDDFYIDCKELMNSKNGGVAVARGWSITHLDVMQKVAYLDDGKEIKYNKCLIATGNEVHI